MEQKRSVRLVLKTSDLTVNSTTNIDNHSHGLTSI